MEERFIKIITFFWQYLAGEAQKDPLSERDKRIVREIGKEFQKKDFLTATREAYTLYDADVAYRRFAARVRPAGKRHWIIGFSSAAAIALLLVLVYEGGRQSGSSVMLPEVPMTVENEIIEPGIKKAILKLADGSQVQMGEKALKIREAGGAQIEYTEGKIAYQSAGTSEELVYNELVVPVAGECYITLDDGSKVWMNADSKLRYPVKFTGEDRKVFLEGEAYFEVAKNGKPFIVSTAWGDVRVLGTSFDVKAYREEEKMYTTLVTGKVCFEGKENIEIAPGEQVVATADGQVRKHTVNPEEYMGWKNGLYVFREHPLEQIMADLARWYGVSVFYQNPELKKITFTGNLRRYERINTFMEVLQRTGDVRYQINGNTIILFQ